MRASTPGMLAWRRTPRAAAAGGHNPRMGRARAAVTAPLLALVLAGCGEDGAAPPTEARWPAQARYALDLRYDAARSTLRGTQRIAFTNAGPAALRSVWLRTWANAYGSCERPLATIEVTGGGEPGERREGCTAQEVRLAEPVAPGARGEVALRIRVTIPREPDRFGMTGKVAFVGNGLPVLAVADRTGWHLPPFTDRGESFFSLAADWRVRLRAPAAMAVASTGQEVATRRDGRERLHDLRAPRARDFALVVGPMAVRSTRAGAVRIRRFTPPGAPAAEVRAALRTSRAALLAYARRLGPYGAPELDVVQGPDTAARGALAMEYPELVVTSAEPRLIAHELAHQWWFHIVGNDQWSEPWLDEGFATYSAMRLPRGVAGPNRFDLCAKLPRDRPPLTAGMELFDRSPGNYSLAVYNAGACALHALERGLGRARFDRFLRRLVAERRYGVLTGDGFVRALRGAAGGFDVDSWMQVWRVELKR